ncbi:MAG: acyltransferase [Gemmatimonadales bacterium]
MKIRQPNEPMLDGNVPALDGVRGLAIIIVMLGHFAIGFTTGTAADVVLKTLMQTGWAGVDLFFSLSGFLITGILIEAKGAPHYFRNFYARRILRIFPVYYAFLFAFFVILPIVKPPAPGGPFDGWNVSQWWFWAYLSNLQILFPAWPRPEPLTHFWSLAVEEQFYLFWPAVVFFTTRKGLFKTCAAFMIFSVVIRIWLQTTGINPTAGYRITPARLDTLGTGAALAILARDPAWWLRIRGFAPKVILAALVGMVAVSIPTRSMLQSSFPMQAVGYSLLAVIGAALIIFSIDPTSDRRPIVRFLRTPFMRFFGKYSYALYIFHLPLTWFLENAGLGVDRFPTVGGSHIPGVIAFTLMTGSISVLMALASWNLFEKHFLRLKTYFPRVESARDELSAKPAVEISHITN